MSCLGKLGRFGNQVFQYTFLRTYAQRYNLDYQASRWEGQRLFGLVDPSIAGRHLPRYNERADKTIHNSAANYQDAWYPPIIPEGREIAGYDYRGYCQFHMKYYSPDRKFIQQLFVPTLEVQQRMRPALDSLYQTDGTLIGFHMRRGDTGRAIFYITPNEWYLAWLEKHWDRFYHPRLFITTEEPTDVEAFSKYNPVIASELLSLKTDRYSFYNYLPYDLRNPTPEAMDWFPDWYFLTQCNVLLFGESTFSFSAAMMSAKLQECWQSRLSTQEFELIDPWGCQPLMREHLDEYPEVAGTRRG